MKTRRMLIALCLSLVTLLSIPTAFS